MKQIKTTLVCSHCFKESPIRITYLRNSPIRLTCENCGYTIKLSGITEQELSLSQWERRLLTKPLRIALETKRDSLNLISMLPIRFITKPLRIIRELEESLR